MNLVAILIGALATWRVTHLLHAEEGPGTVFENIRRRLRAASFGGAVDCFLCLSLWIAAPVAAVIATDWREGILLWPALSALAIAFERLTTLGRPAPAAYQEHLTGEDEDGMLRGKRADRTDRVVGRAAGSDGYRDVGSADGPDGVRRWQGAHRSGSGHG
jgi:hypothetical protein